jgi:hypothetical protein
MLDAGDEQRKVTFYAHLDDAAGPREALAAWSQALLIFADEMDMPSGVMINIANTISKGVQGELPA